MDIPNAKGETKRQVLMHVVKTTNGEIVPPELSINKYCPYELRVVLDTYFKLATTRTTLTPIDPTTTYNWLMMRGQKLSAFEHDALNAMDRAFLNEMNKREQ